MPLPPIVLDRIIVHEVFDRALDGTRVAPRYGDHQLVLDQEATDKFLERIMAAVGQRTKCMDMTVLDPNRVGTISLVRALVAAGEDDFVTASRRFADKLHAAQTHPNVPGGVLVVFLGRTQRTNRPVVGLIKASKHDGFQKRDDLTISLIHDLFLTPQSQLYKVGVFILDENEEAEQCPYGWSAIVYDSLLTASNPDNAAQYFYHSFLDCGIPATGARLTKDFYASTTAFINGNTNWNQEQKLEKQGALVTYLKVENIDRVSPLDFAERYLSPVEQDDFIEYSTERGVPIEAFQRDTTMIASKLKMRRLKFPRSISLLGPQEALNDLVQVEEFNPTPDVVEAERWTRITIKGTLQEQA